MTHPETISHQSFLWIPFPDDTKTTVSAVNTNVPNSVAPLTTCITVSGGRQVENLGMEAPSGPPWISAPLQCIAGKCWGRFRCSRIKRQLLYCFPLATTIGRSGWAARSLVNAESVLGWKVCLEVNRVPSTSVIMSLISSAKGKDMAVLDV